MIRRWLKKQRLLNAERRYRRNIQMTKAFAWNWFEQRVSETDILDGVEELHKFVRAQMITVEEFSTRMDAFATALQQSSETA